MKKRLASLLVLCVVMLVPVVSGCSQQRDLSAEERAGETNFMGNAPTQEPLTNAPGVDTGGGAMPAGAGGATPPSGASGATPPSGAGK